MHQFRRMLTEATIAKLFHYFSSHVFSKDRLKKSSILDFESSCLEKDILASRKFYVIDLCIDGYRTSDTIEDTLKVYEHVKEVIKHSYFNYPNKDDLEQLIFTKTDLSIGRITIMLLEPLVCRFRSRVFLENNLSIMVEGLRRNIVISIKVPIDPDMVLGYQVENYCEINLSVDIKQDTTVKVTIGELVISQLVLHTLAKQHIDDNTARLFEYITRNRNTLTKDTDINSVLPNRININNKSVDD